MVGGGYSVLSEVLGAQDIISFGYGSQSRETMEVEDYSAKSECCGAFERRRETSTKEKIEAIGKRLDQKMQMMRVESAIFNYKVAMEERMDDQRVRMDDQRERMDEMMRMMAMLMNQNQSTTGGLKRKRKQP